MLTRISWGFQIFKELPNSQGFQNNLSLEKRALPYQEDLQRFADDQRACAWGPVLSIVASTVREWWSNYTSWLPTSLQIAEQLEKTRAQAVVCLPCFPPPATATSHVQPGPRTAAHPRPTTACPARGQTPGSCPASCPDHRRGIFTEEQRQAGLATNAVNAAADPASSSAGPSSGGSRDSADDGDQDWS